jgi:phosphate transport system substrate-binding protein
LFRKKHSYDPIAVAVALGSYNTSGRTVALAFLVNKNNPIAQLSFPQLDAIYCTSLRRGSKEQLVRWGQVGLSGEWATRSIHPIGVNFPDGISNFIRLRVCQDGEFRPDISTEHTGGPVNVLQRIATDVSSDPDAIGYAGFANTEPGTKVVPISEDGGRYFSGKYAEVAAGEYPLTRLIYIYFDGKPGAVVSPVSLAFLRYVLSPAGQALVGSDGIYLPLPEPIAARGWKQLQQDSPLGGKN